MGLSQWTRALRTLSKQAHASFWTWGGRSGHNFGMGATRPPTALVLSGGGMRGAYEVGVVSGIAEVMDAAPGSPALFDILAGTSVGAINAAYFAANADSHVHRVERLADTWQSLRLDDHARVRPLGLAPLPDA